MIKLMQWRSLFYRPSRIINNHLDKENYKYPKPECWATQEGMPKRKWVGVPKPKYRATQEGTQRTEYLTVWDDVPSTRKGRLTSVGYAPTEAWELTAGIVHRSSGILSISFLLRYSAVGLCASFCFDLLHDPEPTQCL